MKYAYTLLSFCLIWISSLLAQPLNVSVRADKAILYNPDNGAILYEKKADDPHNPASLTKVATALFLLDHVRPSMDMVCVASKEALKVIHADIRQRDIFKFPPYILEHDGTMMGLAEGDAYPFEMLLHALLLTSSNDAANVLAETSHGSIEKFMEELNNYLFNKGIVNSRFQNPSGFYHPGQWVTAYEIAKIAGLGLKIPEFRQVISTRVYDKNPNEILTNYNKMMKEGKYNYARIIGGKTGYLASAGYNMVVAAEENGRTLIATLLGCESSNQRYEDAITLFEAAFAEGKVSRCLFAEGTRFPRMISKRDEPIEGYIQEKVEISYFPSEEGEVEGNIHWDPLKLPIRKDAQMGTLVVTDERGNELTRSPILAVEAVKGGLPVKRVALGVLLLAAVFIWAIRRRKDIK